MTDGGPGPEFPTPIQGDGARLLQLFKTDAPTALKPRKKELESLERIDGVVLLGSSNAGKTTLVNGIRSASEHDDKLRGKIIVPKRYVTRQYRENDNTTENTFVSSEHFQELVNAGEIDFHWARSLGGVEERYGFKIPQTNRLAVYSGNNALKTESVIPRNILDNLLIVGVYAPDNLRTERMQVRSPDLIEHKPEEAQERLADGAIGMYPHAHIIVKNFGRTQDTASSDTIELVRRVVELKAAA